MKKINTGESIEKRIRITDSALNKQIMQIMTLPEYKSSCNKVINDALFYGLPILYKKLFIGISEEEKEELKRGQTTGTREEHFYAVVEQLLRVNFLNISLVKSMVSSLFNEKVLEVKGLRVYENFEQGLLSDTPDYLHRIEVEENKKIRR